MAAKLEFTDSENPWSPETVIAEINQKVGADLELVGLDDQTGGTSSAAYGRSRRTGVEVAITRTTASWAEMDLAAEVLAIAKAAGCPVPRHYETVELDDGYIAIVQERLPGRRPQRVDTANVDAMVAVNEQFADLLVYRPDVPPPTAFASADVSPWNATLGRYSDRSRRLLDRTRANSDSAGMFGDDLIHLDYSLGNILYDDHGRISGIVDWNRGVARGDRWYALIGTRFNMATEGGLYGVTSEAIARLDTILAANLDGPTLHRYWDHWYLDNAHRSIAGNFPARRIETDLDLAESHQT